MRKTSILKQLAIPQEVADSIAAADEILAAGPRTLIALARNAENILIARAESAEAEEALAQAEAYAVTCIDSDLPAANLAVEAAAKVHDEKMLALKRAERLGVTLKANAKNTDRDVALARDALESVTAKLSIVARDEISAELGEAVKALLKVLHRALALQSVLPNRDLAYAIAGVQIPNPASSVMPFIADGYVTVDGKTSRLDWSADPEAAKIVETFRPIVEARQRLARHIPFRETQPATGRGYTIGGNPRSGNAPAAASNAGEAKPAGQEMNMGLAAHGGLPFSQV